ncbi:hypothetical protein RJ639_030291, partial [Escallonia herrerae]
MSFERSRSRSLERQGKGVRHGLQRSESAEREIKETIEKWSTKELKEGILLSLMLKVRMGTTHSGLLEACQILQQAVDEIRQMGGNPPLDTNVQEVVNAGNVRGAQQVEQPREMLNTAQSIGYFENDLEEQKNANIEQFRALSYGGQGNRNGGNVNPGGRSQGNAWQGNFQRALQGRNRNFYRNGQGRGQGNQMSGCTGSQASFVASSPGDNNKRRNRTAISSMQPSKQARIGERCTYCNWTGHTEDECLRKMGLRIRCAQPGDIGSNCPCSRNQIVPRDNQGRGNLKGNTEKPRMQGRAYGLESQEVRDANGVIEGTLTIFQCVARVLLDPGSTHSFISSYMVSMLPQEPELLPYVLEVSTPNDGGLQRSESAEREIKETIEKWSTKELKEGILLSLMLKVRMGTTHSGLLEACQILQQAVDEIRQMGGNPPLDTNVQEVVNAGNVRGAQQVEQPREMLNTAQSIGYFENDLEEQKNANIEQFRALSYGGQGNRNGGNVNPGGRSQGNAWQGNFQRALQGRNRNFYRNGQGRGQGNQMSGCTGSQASFVASSPGDNNKRRNRTAISSMQPSKQARIGERCTYCNWTGHTEDECLRKMGLRIRCAQPGDIGSNCPCSRNQIVPRDNQGRGNLKGNTEKPRMQGRAYGLESQEVRDANGVIEGTLTIFQCVARVLFDPGSTHSFISSYMVSMLPQEPELLPYVLEVSTPNDGGLQRSESAEREIKETIEKWSTKELKEGILLSLMLKVRMGTTHSGLLEACQILQQAVDEIRQMGGNPPLDTNVQEVVNAGNVRGAQQVEQPREMLNTAQSIGYFENDLEEQKNANIEQFRALSYGGQGNRNGGNVNPGGRSQGNAWQGNFQRALQGRNRNFYRNGQGRGQGNQMSGCTGSQASFVASSPGDNNKRRNRTAISSMQPSKQARIGERCTYCNWTGHTEDECLRKMGLRIRCAQPGDIGSNCPCSRNQIVPRDNQGRGNLKGNTEKPRMQGRAYGLESQEVRDANGVIEGTLTIFQCVARVLFDPGSTHSFISSYMVSMLPQEPELLPYVLEVSTPNDGGLQRSESAEREIKETIEKWSTKELKEGILLSLMLKVRMGTTHSGLLEACQILQQAVDEIRQMGGNPPLDTNVQEVVNAGNVRGAQQVEQPREMLNTAQSIGYFENDLEEQKNANIEQFRALSYGGQGNRNGGNVNPGGRSQGNAWQGNFQRALQGRNRNFYRNGQGRGQGNQMSGCTGSQASFVASSPGDNNKRRNRTAISSMQPSKQARIGERCTYCNWTGHTEDECLRKMGLRIRCAQPGDIGSNCPCSRNQIVPRDNQGRGNLKGNTEKPRMQGRAYGLESQEVRDANGVIEGTLTIFQCVARVLFDPGSTHSFISSYMVSMLPQEPELLPYVLEVSTPNDGGLQRSESAEREIKETIEKWSTKELKEGILLSLMLKVRMGTTHSGLLEACQILQQAVDEIRQMGGNPPLDTNVQEVVNAGNVRGAQQVEQPREMLNTAQSIGYFENDLEEQKNANIEQFRALSYGGQGNRNGGNVNPGGRSQGNAWQGNFQRALQGRNRNFYRNGQGRGQGNQMSGCTGSQASFVASSPGDNNKRRNRTAISSMQPSKQARIGERCTYCNWTGHTEDECLRKMGLRIRCAQPGDIGSNCPCSRNQIVPRDNQGRGNLKGNTEKPRMQGRAYGLESQEVRDANGVIEGTLTIFQCVARVLFDPGSTHSFISSYMVSMLPQEPELLPYVLEVSTPNDGGLQRSESAEREIKETIEKWSTKELKEGILLSLMLKVRMGTTHSGLLEACQILQQAVDEIRQMGGNPPLDTNVQEAMLEVLNKLSNPGEMLNTAQSIGYFENDLEEQKNANIEQFRALSYGGQGNRNGGNVNPGGRSQGNAWQGNFQRALQGRNRNFYRNGQGRGQGNQMSGCTGSQASFVASSPGDNNKRRNRTAISSMQPSKQARIGERCTYCNWTGHTEDECLRKMGLRIRCAQPGDIGSNCPCSRNQIVPRDNQGRGNLKGNTEKPRMQGRAYGLESQEVRDANGVIEGTLTIFQCVARVLFDPGSTHSFISSYMVSMLPQEPELLPYVLEVSTPNDGGLQRSESAEREIKETIEKWSTKELKEGILLSLMLKVRMGTTHSGLLEACQILQQAVDEIRQMGGNPPLDTNVQEVVNAGNVRGAQQVEQPREMLNTAQSIGYFENDLEEQKNANIEQFRALSYGGQGNRNGGNVNPGGRSQGNAWQGNFQRALQGRNRNFYRNGQGRGQGNQMSGCTGSQASFVASSPGDNNKRRNRTAISSMQPSKQARIGERCTYCNWTGHTEDECLRKMGLRIRCAQPGDIGSNCPCSRNQIVPRDNQGRGNLKGNTEKPRMQGRAYGLESQEVRDANGVIEGTLTIFQCVARVLFDPGSTHSFISSYMVSMLPQEPELLPYVLEVSTPNDGGLQRSESAEREIKETIEKWSTKELKEGILLSLMLKVRMGTTHSGLLEACQILQQAVDEIRQMGGNPPLDTNVQEVVNAGNVRGAQQVEQPREMLNTAQ